MKSCRADRIMIGRCRSPRRPPSLEPTPSASTRYALSPAPTQQARADLVLVSILSRKKVRTSVTFHRQVALISLCWAAGKVLGAMDVGRGPRAEVRSRAPARPIPAPPPQRSLKSLHPTRTNNITRSLYSGPRPSRLPASPSTPASRSSTPPAWTPTARSSTRSTPSRP